jgi:Xaa-Pro aminopeptidase
MALEAGMLVVVQPNVTSENSKAGVQTGECLLITEDGYERIHTFPRLSTGRLMPGFKLGFRRRVL